MTKLVVCLFAALVPSLDAAPIGQFEGHEDIGAPAKAGGAAYNAVSQSYSIQAAGHNMWASRDEFHFLWKRLKGDFILQARGEWIGKGTDLHRKFGWMVRAGLSATAAYADAAVHGDGLASLQFRRMDKAITEEVKSDVAAPDYIQLERRGGEYFFACAKFGEPLQVVRTNVALDDEVFVGLFVCSHHSNVVEQAVFRDVRIVQPAKSNFVPYRDYVGSHLEILDVNNGSRQVVLTSSQPIEAPNWTPDGRALIYNSSGRDASFRGKLHRFDLETRQIQLINTGTATRNNNDHVLSFDGTMIGISHHSPEHGGRSAIYTVPLSGGEPKRITSQTPSYLHGWSPDGKWLVFTGGRNDEYDIYKIPADGGDEIRLTTTKGLDDGPEYSPDGKTIWFNSSRSGRMHIWKMNIDGTNQEQVTHDDFNNWFPHVSPNGEFVAFLSFANDVSPTDHPYYKQVYLRLIPSKGGDPKVIAYVYGGQGTLNVPSWAPDSRMLAFVSNSQLP